jgi:hypothetical protein
MLMTNSEFILGGSQIAAGATLDYFFAANKLGDSEIMRVTPVAFLDHTWDSIVWLSWMSGSRLTVRLQNIAGTAVTPTPQAFLFKSSENPNLQGGQS